jgi:NCS1 family nucleobase:cation symporter-1
MVFPAKDLLTTVSKKFHEKKAATKRALSSRDNLIRALEVNETAYGRTEERTFWKNEDLDLTPPSQWTWGWYDFAAFWWSYGFSVGVWSVGSSMVAMGLNAWQCESYYTVLRLLTWYHEHFRTSF